jgi:hypothetical protein
MRRALIQTLATLLVLNTGIARADVYAFTDTAGVTHFSNVPNDARYQLLLRSPPDEPVPSDGKHTRRWLKASSQYDPMIERAARTSTLHPALIRAVIVVESGFNPRARSKRGAQGLMQLMPDTARRYGVRDAYDPKANIDGGARYLADLIQRFGNNLELALAAYNAGEGAVERSGNRMPPFGETQRYVPNVLRVYHALLAQQKS